MYPVTPFWLVGSRCNPNVCSSSVIGTVKRGFQLNAMIFLCFWSSCASPLSQLSVPECGLWTLHCYATGERARALINLKRVLTARVNIYTWCSQILFFLITQFPAQWLELERSTGPRIIPLYSPPPAPHSHSINSDLIRDLCLTSLSSLRKWYWPMVLTQWGHNHPGGDQTSHQKLEYSIFKYSHSDSFLFSSQFSIHF